MTKLSLRTALPAILLAIVMIFGSAGQVFAQAPVDKVDVLVSFKDKPGKASRSSALSFRARYSSKPGAKAKTLTRSYTISLVAIDLAGNESRAETTVVVPHNPGKGQPH